MLEKEFKYYLNHQEELVKKYNGKFLVIKEEKVVGAYDTKEMAYNEASSQFELGTFLIQQCLPGEQSHTETFHSQVSFHKSI